MQNCTETNRNKPFPGYIDPDSLIVQDDYVFVQVRRPDFCSLAQGISSVCLVTALSACLHTLRGKEEMDQKGGQEGQREERRWKRGGGKRGKKGGREELGSRAIF